MKENAIQIYANAAVPQNTVFTIINGIIHEHAATFGGGGGGGGCGTRVEIVMQSRPNKKLLLLKR